MNESKSSTISWQNDQYVHMNYCQTLALHLTSFYMISLNAVYALLKSKKSNGWRIPTLNNHSTHSKWSKRQCHNFNDNWFSFCLCLTLTSYKFVEEETFILFTWPNLGSKSNLLYLTARLGSVSLNLIIHLLFIQC
jgi:hypothetical protein